MITLCKTGCFNSGAKNLPEKLQQAGFAVSTELCLDRCIPCEGGQIVGKVDGEFVAQSADEWLALTQH